MPLKALGNRIDPPPSVPIDSGDNPPATATPDPPLEPPDVRVRSQGFTDSSDTRFTARPYMPNSGVFVLPMRIAPAARRRAHTVESSSGTQSSYRREACVVRTSFVTTRSLIDNGSPCSGPSSSSRMTWSSAARAASRRVVVRDGDHRVQRGFELVESVEEVLRQLHR